MSLIDLASLVLAPTATKEGKVYSAIPDTGEGDMTFTRGSAATRVNSEGLIEKERANLLLQSNSFDTTWIKSYATVTSGQTGYDGSSDAWLQQSTSTFCRLDQNITQTGILTLSAYAKAGTSNFLLLEITGSVFYAWFDLSSGVVGTTSAIDANIESVGNGWYRCSLIGNQTLSGQARLRVADSNGSTVTTTSSNIYIQDAMLNQGLVAQSYIPTTTTAVYEGITDDLPRVDYSGGGCPSLLLEGSRTNGVTQSEYFDSWLNKPDVTLDFGYLAPDGTNSAYKVTKTGANAHIADNFGGIIVSGVYKSIWAKTTSGTGKVSLLNGQSDTNALFDLTEEWQRFDIAHNGANFFYAVDFRNASATLTEVLIYGAQAETGSYPTSYIPTYGTSTSRSADSCSLTNASNLIGQSEGTMFVEFKLNKVNLPNNHTWIATKDSSQTNRILVYMLTNESTLRGQIKHSGTAINFNFGTISDNQNIKIAIAYKSGDSAVYINGSSVATNTNTLSFGTMDIFSFNDASTSVDGEVNQTILFPTRLTNDQLQELTK